MSPPARLRIGTRPSPLARAQTALVEELLKAGAPELEIEIVPISSAGDTDLTTPLSQVPRGVFASALEEALAAGRIDCAVHSSKDLPVTGPTIDAELMTVGYLQREVASDALCVHERHGPGATLDGLPVGARVGTGSARRTAQLRTVRPDLQIIPLRGNVGTRLAALEADDLDAVVLAAAGLRRLGLASHITQLLPLSVHVPDPGQGAVALQVAVPAFGQLLESVPDLLCAETARAVTLERAIAAALGGGCTHPVGVHVTSSHVLAFRAPSAGRPGRTVARPISVEASEVELIEAVCASLRGHVSLVGAGPGDPGLVTVRAQELVAAADVLVHDRLIPATLVDHAPPGCEVVDAGKTNANHKLSQDEINAVLVERALAGAHVVRLKGGDPFTFGRGGEEAVACRAAGVAFDVVPGVTSGISVPAYAGIPVTHRGVSGAVTLITASGGPTGLDDPDYAWLASATGTVVLYMGLRRVAHVASRLIAAGAPIDRPIAVISQGATSRQTTVVGTLADIAERLAEAELRSPGLIVVGDAVGLRAELNWFEHVPLFGHSIVVTRARAQSSDLASRLTSLGADVVEAPAMRVHRRPLGAEQLAAVRDAQLVIFTSMNGVESLRASCEHRGLDSRAVGPGRIAAIGSATAAALRAWGIRPDIVPPAGQRTAVGMLTHLTSADILPKRVVLVRAVVGDDRLPEGIRAAGSTVEVIHAYETMSDGLDEQAARGVAEAQFVTFASAATVESFVTACSARGVTPPQAAVSIGPTTTRAAQAAGFDVRAEADDPSVEGLVQAVCRAAGATADRLPA